MAILGDNCQFCGVVLRGGDTIHEKECPIYPQTYWAIVNDPEARAEWERQFGRAS